MTQLTKSRLNALALHVATAFLMLLTWISAQGNNPFHGLIPDTAWSWITLIAALAMGMYDGWKNHNWTPESIAAQNILDSMKNDYKKQSLSTAANVSQIKIQEPAQSTIQESLGVPTVSESSGKIETKEAE